MSSHGDPIPMTARRGGPLKGVAEVPGDKSISHRSLILGAMSVGETRVTGLLEGQDVLDTAKAMQAFGAQVERSDDGEWTIHGVGVGGFGEPEDVIDCGNSGTGVRLIMGAMATMLFRNSLSLACVCVCVCMCVYVCMCVCICLYECICVYVHVCMYVKRRFCQ